MPITCLMGKAAIRSMGARRPRLHDLRHTFAVRVLQSSPAGRSRCGAQMAALATYMGHVNIYSTYWYLEATADLMRDVAVAAEGFVSEGRQA
jgi:integrase/recombinase XerD